MHLSVLCVLQPDTKNAIPPALGLLMVGGWSCCTIGEAISVCGYSVAFLHEEILIGAGPEKMDGSWTCRDGNGF